MTQKHQTKLTPEQAERMAEDANRGYADGLRQLDEHQESLVEVLNELNPMEFGLSPQQLGQLISQVADIKLVQVISEPAMKEGDKQTVSTVWEYPDELHAFLSRSDFKSPFNITTQGGITLDQETPSIKA